MVFTRMYSPAAPECQALQSVCCDLIRASLLPAQDKELEDYEPADIAMALTRMVSYNIGHLAYLNAKRYNLSRVFFGGFYIRGHPYTMETISFAIRFWSKVGCVRSRSHE